MKRALALAIALTLAWTAGSAAAQTTVPDPANVAEAIALTLRNEGSDAEEPLGTQVSCSPYEVVYPELQLSCFELSMPPDLARIWIEEFVEREEAFAWVDDAWRTVEVPGEATAADENDRQHRTMTHPEAREAVVGVFTLQRTVAVVLAVRVP